MADSSSTRGVVSSILSGMYNLGYAVPLFTTCFNIYQDVLRRIYWPNNKWCTCTRHLSRDNLQFRDTFVRLLPFPYQKCREFRPGIFVCESKNAGSIYGFILLVARGRESQKVVATPSDAQRKVRDNLVDITVVFCFTKYCWEFWLVCNWNTAFLFSSRTGFSRFFRKWNATTVSHNVLIESIVRGIFDICSRALGQ